MKRFCGWLSLLVAALLVAAMPVPVAQAAPARPTGLTAVPLGSSSIQLNWTDAGADHYQLYCGTSASHLSYYDTAYAATYTAERLNCNTRYFFKVRACTSREATGPFSATVSARTSDGIAAPAFVTALASSSSVISLSWPEVPGATKGYVVYRATSSSGHYAAFATTSSSQCYYHHDVLQGNARRYYKVRAKNSEGEGYFSPSANARTCPSAVTGLSALALGTGGVRLTWNASSGATKYRIYCAEPSSTFLPIGQTTKRYFTHTLVGRSMAYRYKVAAISAAGEGDLSGEAGAFTAPAVPSGLTAQALTISKIKLTWAAADGATGYAVYPASPITTRWCSITI